MEAYRCKGWIQLSKVMPLSTTFLESIQWHSYDAEQLFPARHVYKGSRATLFAERAIVLSSASKCQPWSKTLNLYELSATENASCLLFSVCSVFPRACCAHMRVRCGVGNIRIRASETHVRYTLYASYSNHL